MKSNTMKLAAAALSAVALGAVFAQDHEEAEGVQ